MNTYFNKKYHIGLKALSFCALITTYNTVMPMTPLSFITKAAPVVPQIVIPVAIDLFNKKECIKGIISLFQTRSFPTLSNGAAFTSLITLGTNVLWRLVDNKILDTSLPLDDKKNVKTNMTIRLLIPFLLQCSAICYFNKETLGKKALYSLAILVNMVIANHDLIKTAFSTIVSE